MHGLGTYEWPDGKKYVGDYHMDKKQGYGEYKFSDGRIYKGQWKDGLQEGEGVIIYPSDNFRIKKGIWQKGKKVQSLKMTKEEKERFAQNSQENSQILPSINIQNRSLQQKICNILEISS